MTDPITDMLNRIRNAKAVKKPDVFVMHSNLKYQIATLLAKNGFIADVKKVAKGKAKAMKITLKYDQGVSAIEDAKRVSKPGQRIYAGADGIKKVKGGFGVSIISTSKGLMTGVEAKKARLGGEVLLEVW